MVVSYCCFITVTPGATSCSNPNMTTDPYGKPFRTVLGYLCEIKRLTAIFKCSCTLSSHLPCGLLPSQIIFVYDHLTNDFCQSEKRRTCSDAQKKKHWFGLLHSDSSKASPICFVFSLSGDVSPSEYVLLCYPDYTHCSIFVLLRLFIKRLRHRWPWRGDSTALQTKPPINPSERGRHESRLILQSRPHWSRHSDCLEPSIKQPKLLMYVSSRGWTQGEECVYFCLGFIINPESKMKMKMRCGERVVPLLDSFRVASCLASASNGIEKSDPDYTQKCQKWAEIDSSKQKHKVSISLLASKVRFKSSQAPTRTTCHWFC